MEAESPAAEGLATLSWFDAALQWMGFGLEVAGVAAIVGGALFAVARVLRQVARGADRGETYHLFRTSLARAILLGLEFLVAADIIGTVLVEPTLQNLAVLSLLVLIRTFLSFTLEVEITGRWPWQQTPAQGAPPGGNER